MKEITLLIKKRHFLIFW